MKNSWHCFHYFQEAYAFTGRRSRIISSSRSSITTQQDQKLFYRLFCWNFGICSCVAYTSHMGELHVLNILKALSLKKESLAFFFFFWTRLTSQSRNNYYGSSSVLLHGKLLLFIFYKNNLPDVMK